MMRSQMRIGTMFRFEDQTYLCREVTALRVIAVLCDERGRPLARARESVFALNDGDLAPGSSPSAAAPVAGQPDVVAGLRAMPDERPFDSLALARCFLFEPLAASAAAGP